MKGLIVAAALLLSACTSARTYVESPMQSPGINGGKTHYHNLVVLKDQGDLLHVTESRSWVEVCGEKITNPKTQEEWSYPYRNCHKETGIMANGAPSAAQQIVTPLTTTIVQGGAFVGGMKVLGDGIGRSGARTTNNNSTSSDGGSSASNSEASAKGGNSSAKVNSDNKTATHNQQTYINNSQTKINSDNTSIIGGKH